MTFISNQGCYTLSSNIEMERIVKVNDQCQVCHKLILEASAIRKLICDHLLHEACFQRGANNLKRRCLTCFKPYSHPQLNNLFDGLGAITTEKWDGLQSKLHLFSFLKSPLGRMATRFFILFEIVFILGLSENKRFQTVAWTINGIILGLSLILVSVPFVILLKEVIWSPRSKRLKSLEAYQIELIENKRNFLFNK